VGKSGDPVLGCLLLPPSYVVIVIIFLHYQKGRDVLLCFRFVLADFGLGGVCKKEPRVRGGGAVYSGGKTSWVHVC